ncbi:MAG TPA: amino acid deaminase [Actinocrinis sp.]|nr:amino acid deaminase [Actinocrinis sp.]
MDVAALDRLGEERIGWRYKGFPAAFAQLTVAELVAAKPALAEFGTPLLLLDAGALAHNLATMAGYCARHGVDLSPHGKTTMAPQLFARQLAAGSWGITAATIAHVRAYRAFGVATVLLGNELLDPDALAWVAAELRQDPQFRLLCFADSVAGVELMQAALDAADAPRPVDVIIDLGLPGGRTGCRNPQEALVVARTVRAASRLRVVGVGGFEGALAPDRAQESLDRIRGYLHMVRETASLLDQHELFDEAPEILLTAGGSAYFDDVVEILTAPWQASLPVRTVLRSGAYITHDDGHYRRLTPFAAPEPGGEQDGEPRDAFRPALRLHGRVLSLPEPGLALLDFGKRDAPFDLGLPEPQHVRRADGAVQRLGADCVIKSLADQHAFLAYGPETQFSLGDIVSCGISHPCTAFDKWQLIPVVEGEQVVDVIRTFF